MNKLVALSTVAAMALALGACGKTEDSANVADNAVANEIVPVEGNFAENITADNVVLGDNAVSELDANVTDPAAANATNAN